MLLRWNKTSEAKKECKKVSAARKTGALLERSRVGQRPAQPLPAASGVGAAPVRL